MDAQRSALDTGLSAVAALMAALLLVRLVRWYMHVPHRPSACVITGAAGGLGAACARVCVHTHASLRTVELWDVSWEPLTALVEELRRAHPHMTWLPRLVDVGSRAAIDAAVDACVHAHARTHAHTLTADSAASWLVISNAGVLRCADTSAVTHADMHASFSVNALAMLWLFQAFRRVHTSRLTLVAVSSVMAQLAAAQLTAYCASKAALAAVCDCIVQETTRDAIADSVRVVCVFPYHLRCGTSGARMMCPRFILTSSYLSMHSCSDTQMFRGALAAGPRWVTLIRNALFPSLAAQDVARTMLYAAVHGSTSRVYVPYILGWISSFLQLLPDSMRVFVIGIGGGWWPMNAPSSFVSHGQHVFPRRLSCSEELPPASTAPVGRSIQRRRRPSATRTKYTA